MKILDVPRSGSYQGVTSSRNRFGQYVRTRATPVNPNSAAQSNVRNRLAVNAIAWRALTDAQRAGWEGLGSQVTRVDSLGQSYTLNGFSMYCSLNSLKAAAGDAAVSDAPAMVAPQNIVTATITLTSASLSIAYTATPLAANTKLFIYASPQRNAGRTYEADYRLIAVTAAAAASPHNLLAAYTARFGAPVTGNKIFFSFQAYQAGWVSGAYQVSQVVS